MHTFWVGDIHHSKLRHVVCMKIPWTYSQEPKKLFPLLQLIIVSSPFSFHGELNYFPTIIIHQFIVTTSSQHLKDSLTKVCISDMNNISWQSHIHTQPLHKQFSNHQRAHNNLSHESCVGNKDSNSKAKKCNETYMTRSWSQHYN